MRNTTARVTRISHLCKRNKFTEPSLSGTQVYSGASSIEFRMWRQHWKEWENWRKSRDGSWQKSKTKKRWSMKQGIRNKLSFCVIDGSVLSQEFGVRASISKVQRQSRTPRWHCEGWFRIFLTRYSLNKDHLHHKRQLVQEKPQAQYPLTPSSKWRIHHLYSKFQIRNDHTFGYVYRNTNVPNHGPSM